MVARNPHMAQLSREYLFPEVRKRKEAALAQRPDAKLISLSIGDASEPISPFASKAMANQSISLSTGDGFTGYGPEQGIEDLRGAICMHYYNGIVDQNEIFVSDGAKCDIARLQTLFGGDITTAVQDPSYPVYVDTALLMGQKVLKLPCTPENDFFPDVSNAPDFDLLYFCNPNNPTGAVATRFQLTQLVQEVRRRSAILIFDAAYATFIQDPDLPKTIFEIDGAKECCIEIQSFSKIAGFTGVRLAWTVVPEALRFSDGTSVHSDWTRIMTTCFNGASIIAQHGGLAVLTPKGWQEAQELCRFYLHNAALLRKSFSDYEIYGGIHAPYLWVRIPSMTSWQAFDHFLEEYDIVTTPGSGFGPSGEGFLRLSAFGHRSVIEEAVKRLAIPHHLHRSRSR